MQALCCSVRLAVFLGVGLAVTALRAAPWAVVVDSPSNRICTLDFGTATPTVHGPFLYGQMGSFGGGLFDIAITPDGDTALISNFGDSTIYRVDISDPARPIVTGSVLAGFFAEDIDITPDGKYALVTDGGFSTNLGIINLASFTTCITHYVTSGWANAVAIAPDNQTVIMADYFQGGIMYGKLTPTGLVSDTFLPTLSDSGETNRPVNVAISPDGKTVITANAGTNQFNVYEIVAPGVVVPGVTPVVACAVLPYGGQSVVFSPAGDRAYLLQNGMNTNITDEHGFNNLTWLQVNGPGDVTMGGEDVALLAAEGTSQLFGVDTLDVTPDGARAIACNPTLSGGTNLISLVNLSDFSVTYMDINQFIPVGVAFIRKPAFETTITPGAIGHIPVVGETLTCRITVANTGFATLNPVRLDLTYNPAYLAPSGVTQPANLIPGNVVTWENVGTLMVGETTVVTARFTVLKATLPDASVATLVTAPQVLGGYALPPQTSQVELVTANTVFPMWEDYDGDGIADPALYVESTGAWFARLSGSAYATATAQFGGLGQLPVPGDYDGDGKADAVLYKPATATWHAMLSANNYATASLSGFGGPAFLPVPGDFDGDGLSDLALYQRITGEWQVMLSGSGYNIATLTGFGGLGRMPLSGNFDADALADLAIYSAGNGTWQFLLSGSGYGSVVLPEFGGQSFLPLIGDFDGDGLDDPAIYNQILRRLIVKLSSSGYMDWTIPDFGGFMTEPGAADYDRDGIADPLFMNELTGKWHVQLSSLNYIEGVLNSGYVP